MEGTKAAIYISDNAYVENINIKNGAQIVGDIISEWNSESSMGIAEVQTDETKYTNINLSGTVDINGNITGENEIQNTLKMNAVAGSVVNFNREEININSLDNKGDINISQNAVISTVNNTIKCNGKANLLFSQVI